MTNKDAGKNDQGNPFAHLEKDPGLQDKSEQKEKENKKIDALKSSKEGQRLSELLGLENSSIYYTIVNKISLHDENITKENLIDAINTIINDPNICRSLGVGFNIGDGERFKKLLVDGVFSNDNEAGQGGDNTDTNNNSENGETGMLNKLGENVGNGLEGKKEKLFETPEYPTLNGLLNNGTINNKEFNALTKDIYEGVNIEESLGKNITDSKKREEILKIFSSIERNDTDEKNNQKFNDDFGSDIKRIAEKNGKKDEGKTLLLEKVGRRYLLLGSKEGSKENKTTAMKRAFQVEANFMLKGQNTVNRSTETFKRIMETIRTENSMEGLTNSLLELQTYISSYNGKSAKKGSLDWVATHQEENGNNNGDFIDEIQLLLKNARNNAEKNTEISEKIRKIAICIEEIAEINKEKAEEMEIKLGALIQKNNASIEEYDELLDESNSYLSENRGVKE